MATPPYWCHNRERPHVGAPMPMQDGWHEDGRRRMIDVPIRLSVDRCMYDRTQSDERCAGCKWTHS